MSLRDRLDDARLLWSKGRKEGAFVMVLIAVAATSRKRYPQSRVKSDGEAFKKFVLDEMGTITGGPSLNVAFPFKGQQSVPLEEILYRHLRCQLVHEGAMPESIVFTQPQLKNGRFCNVLRLRDPLGFPEGWIENLLCAVCEAPENADLFSSGRQPGTP